MMMMRAATLLALTTTASALPCSTRRSLLPAAVSASLLSQVVLPAGQAQAAASPRPYLVTGATSGIGRAAATKLAAEGRFVLCAARTAEGAQVRAATQDPEAALAGFGLALSLGCEQSDLASVRHFMEQLERDQQAGVEGALLCAGVEALPLRRTKQELEATFAVNVLSHFIIAVELAARAVQSRRALRLVSVTSSAAFDSKLGSGPLDLNWESRQYDARAAYVDSKACNVLLADEMQRRVATADGNKISSPILVCSADPGPTASMLVRYALPQRAAQRAAMTDEQLRRQARMLSQRTPTQAAQGLVWCLTAAECTPGALYLGAAAPPDADPPLPVWAAPLPWRDPGLATEVWTECARRADPFLTPLARKFVA